MEMCSIFLLSIDERFVLAHFQMSALSPQMKIKRLVTPTARHASTITSAQIEVFYVQHLVFLTFDSAAEIRMTRILAEFSEIPPKRDIPKCFSS